MRSSSLRVRVKPRETASEKYYLPVVSVKATTEG